MPNQKSEKPLVSILITGCIIVILTFHFAWTEQYFTNLHNLFFLVVDFGLLILFAFQAKIAYNHADDPNKNWRRVLIVCIAVLSSAWAGAWAAGLNEKVGI